jgi:ubiquitin-conjugating enzyme E2 C
MASKIKRIQTEFKNLNSEGGSDYSAIIPDESNFFEWIVTIMGPPDSVYDGIRYKLSISFPDNYPFKPPTIKFITPIYHANVMLTTGEICLDILKENWAPVLTIPKILVSLRVLMAAPNVSSALNHDAGMLFEKDVAALKAKVIEMAATYPV